MVRRHIRDFTLTNMADGLTDGDLRRQLLQLGAKTVGPITATTRPIYVKKLNHLKVAAKKANAAAPEPRRGRKLLGFSSDEGSEGEDSPGPATTGGGRRRGRAAGRTAGANSSRDTRNNNNKDTAPVAANNSFSLLGRPPLRRSIHDGGGSNSHSFSMQASFNNSGSSRGGGGGRRGAADRASDRVTDSQFDSSDSDVDSTDNPLDDTDAGVDDDSWAASPERVSVSTNTSPRLDDSSLFDRTLSRLGVWGGGRYGGRRSELGGASGLDISSSRLSPRPLSSTTTHLDDVASSPTAGYLNHRPTSSSRRGKAGPSSPPAITSTTTSNNPTPSRGGPTPSRGGGPTPSRGGGPTPSTSRDLGGAPSQLGARRRTAPNSNHVGSTKSAEDKLVDEELILQQGFKTQEDPSGYNTSQYISVVLLSFLTLFFVALTGVYIMSLYPAKIEVVDVPSKDIWMICPPDNAAGSSAECYPREQVEMAREVVLELFEILSIRAGDFECRRSDRRNMTKTEARTRLVNKYGSQQFGDDGKKYNFMIAIHLIHKNPHWQISLYNGRGDVVVRHVDMEWMESQVPYQSLLCRAQRMAMTACYVLAGLLIVLSLAGLCWWRLKRREEETRSMHHLVERIIDVMKGHHDKCQTNEDMQPYLAIPHVRDMLIPPKDRRSLQSRWDAAVKFLSDNESRIRVETQKISGEEFAVWRWLQTHANGKVWQGPAFGENRDANVPPNLKNFKFQCLKIRNMFDPDIECDDDWHVNIEDAILEKVSLNDAQHGIVHIAVDKMSREGCVYVKCASAPEAAKAYIALHGWWFDKNLVTVKYLRLERYYERYPDAVHATTPLSPSNNQRRSLSQPFHRSIYESC